MRFVSVLRRSQGQEGRCDKLDLDGALATHQEVHCSQMRRTVGSHNICNNQRSQVGVHIADSWQQDQLCLLRHQTAYPLRPRLPLQASKMLQQHPADHRHQHLEVGNPT